MEVLVRSLDMPHQTASLTDCRNTEELSNAPIAQPDAIAKTEAALLSAVNEQPMEVPKHDATNEITNLLAQQKESIIQVEDLDARTNTSSTPTQDEETVAPAASTEAPAASPRDSLQELAILQKESVELKAQLGALIERLSKIEKSSAASTVETKHADHSDIRPGIKRLTMDQWKPQDHKGSETLTHDITVYYDQLLVDETDLEGLSQARYQRPRRVQVTSHELRDELAGIVGSSMIQCPTCFVHPFRPLILHHDKLERATVAKKTSLEQTKPSTEEKEMGPETADAAAAAKKKAQTKQMVESMEALLAFVRTELKDELDLRERVRRREVTSLAHHDLWHLFEPGDLVFRQEKKGNNEDVLRLYRVHYVSGGRPSLSSQVKKGQTTHDLDKSDETTALDALENQEQSSKSTQPPSGKDAIPLYLACHNFVFNGYEVGAEEQGFSIKGYPGEKPIKDLKIFPISYCGDWRKRLERLKLRGKKVQALIKAGAAHKEYDGYTIDKKQIISGEVVVDFQEIARSMLTVELSVFVGSGMDSKGTFERWDCGVPSCILQTCTRNFDDTTMEAEKMLTWFNANLHELDIIDPMQEELPDHYLTLMSHKVGAYSLHQRKWHELDVDDIRDIPHADIEMKNCFDDVVMNKDNKRLLLALVSQHPSGKALRGGSKNKNDTIMQADLVKGKGQGLVILLHGPPGVGKTLTAETIAVHTRRPLYAITCGDIGQSPTEIEANLERHFDLAHKWGCVLLLDEADVFLAERAVGDIKRNAMVSVFLRVLEYYPGILFLTTNQVGQLDEAFKSRIAIQLHYPKLDKDSTIKLWTNHLRRIDDRNKELDKRAKISVEDKQEAPVKIAFDQAKLLEFAEKHYEANAKLNLAWNGRQVRNAFQTAIALAEYGRLQKIKDRAKEDEKSEEAIKAKYYKTIDLKVDHFKRVAKTARTFEDYLKTVKHDKVAADLARARELRNDDFDPRMPQSQKLRHLQRSQTSMPGTPTSMIDVHTPTNNRRKSVHTPAFAQNQSNVEAEKNGYFEAALSSAAESGEEEEDSYS